jgi:hypothetical protein
MVVRGGSGAHRVSRIITQPTRVVWTFMRTLPPLPKPQPQLEPAYTAFVAGQDVTEALRIAVSWLDRTLATP